LASWFAIPRANCWGSSNERMPTGYDMTQMLHHRIRSAAMAIEIDHWHRGSADPKTTAWWARTARTAGLGGYLWRVPRPGRLAAFLEIVPELTDAEYWRLLGTIWTDTEMPNVNRPLWLTLFMSKRGNRDQAMDAEGHAAVDCLPEPVQIYRAADLKCVRACRGRQTQTRLHGLRTASDIAVRFLRRRGRNGRSWPILTIAVSGRSSLILGGFASRCWIGQRSNSTKPQSVLPTGARRKRGTARFHAERK
jgi:hypothetical protein